MRNYHDQLQIKALTDLTNRAKSGIFVYLANWLVLGYTFDLHERHPVMFYLNTGLFAGIMLSRLLHLIVTQKKSTTDTSMLNLWLVFTVLLGGLHWGMLAAWFIQAPGMDDVLICTIILTPCFALGGACTLCISQEIRNWFPIVTIVPPMVALVLVGGHTNLVIAGLSGFLLLYISSSTKASHDDYWSAITNHMVSEERAHMMEKLSTIDALTQLKNRLFFDNELEQEWKRCLRIGCPLSVLMLDLDHFKKINDTHGHLFGDECLRNVALTLASEAKRPADCVARYGGEEFIILLPNTNERGTEIIGRRVLEAISRIELALNGQPIRLTCSIGAATLIPEGELRPTTLLQQADAALYTAKEEGRNRYVAWQT